MRRAAAWLLVTPWLAFGCAPDACPWLGDRDEDVERVGFLSGTGLHDDVTTAADAGAFAELWVGAGGDPAEVPAVDFAERQAVFVMLREGSCGPNEAETVTGFFALRSDPQALVAKIEHPACDPNGCADADSSLEVWSTRIAEVSACTSRVPCPSDPGNR